MLLSSHRPRDRYVAVSYILTSAHCSPIAPPSARYPSAIELDSMNYPWPAPAGAFHTTRATSPLSSPTTIAFPTAPTLLPNPFHSMAFHLATATSPTTSSTMFPYRHSTTIPPVARLSIVLAYSTTTIRPIFCSASLPLSGTTTLSSTPHNSSTPCLAAQPEAPPQAPPPQASPSHTPVQPTAPATEQTTATTDPSSPASTIRTHLTTLPPEHPQQRPFSLKRHHTSNNSFTAYHYQCTGPSPTSTHARGSPTSTSISSTSSSATNSTAPPTTPSSNTDRSNGQIDLTLRDSHLHHEASGLHHPCANVHVLHHDNIFA